MPSGSYVHPPVVCFCGPPVALVYLCAPVSLSMAVYTPGGVTRFLAKFLFVTSVFSDNCFLEAPGAFNVVTYTPRWP